MASKCPVRDFFFSSYDSFANLEVQYSLKDPGKQVHDKQATVMKTRESNKLYLVVNQLGPKPIKVYKLDKKSISRIWYAPN